MIMLYPYLHRSTVTFNHDFPLSFSRHAEPKGIDDSDISDEDSHPNKTNNGKNWVSHRILALLLLMQIQFLAIFLPKIARKEFYILIFFLIHIHVLCMFCISLS